MREIIFRGKDRTGIMNHLWQEGSLDNTNEEFPKIVRLDRWGNKMLIDVAPETVGQYTGLTDMYGKKIFEGDIVEFGEYRYTVEWKRDRCGFGYEETEDRRLECDGLHCVVVGNIFDNPELLKRADR